MSTPAYSDSQTTEAPSSQYAYYQSQGYAEASQPQVSQATTAVAGSSTSAAATNTPAQPQTRQAAEEARKDRTLAEFLVMLDEYEPLVRIC